VDSKGGIDLFFRLHKVERIGMGIRKMKEAMVPAGLRKPTFKPHGVYQAIFYRASELAMKERKEGSENIPALLEARNETSINSRRYSE